MVKKHKNEEAPFFWIKGGLEKLPKSIHGIHNLEPEARPNPQINNKRNVPLDTARAGLKDGWIRATLIVREENLKKIKNLAYWDRKGIKDIVDDALNLYLKDKNIPPPSSKP